jgi:hypothetical protein
MTWSSKRLPSSAVVSLGGELTGWAGFVEAAGVRWPGDGEGVVEWVGSGANSRAPLTSVSSTADAAGGEKFGVG